MRRSTVLCLPLQKGIPEVSNQLKGKLVMLLHNLPPLKYSINKRKKKSDLVKNVVLDSSYKTFYGSK
jgi:hypothetical protein